jgi:hypothetical protein
MAFIHLYQGNPTSGGTDGTLVSESGTYINAINTTLLNASNLEVGTWQKLAIRCDNNYATSGNVTIAPVGTSASDWQFAPDNSGSPGVAQGWGNPLVISTQVSTTNTIFWVQAKTTVTDTVPVSDKNVSINFSANIMATN